MKEAEDVAKRVQKRLAKMVAARAFLVKDHPAGTRQK